MMNFNKLITLLSVLALTSCSDAPEQEVKEPVVAPAKQVTKKIDKNHALKGYQDNLQRAKDMEKEVLKAAERQKKAIDDASN